MLGNWGSVWLVYSSFLTGFTLEVRTYYCKQSALSQCGGNPLQSRESLEVRSQSSAPGKLLHFLIGNDPQIAPVMLASESGGLGGMQNVARALAARKGITARKSLLTQPPCVSSSGL